jgi:hypothetical protein
VASESVYSEVQETAVIPANDTIIDNPERREIDVAAANRTECSALFSGGDLNEFRTRWREIQGGFVDEPRRAVEDANQLVELVIQRLTTLFASERGKLEDQWKEGKDASTEDLRQALRRYRSFFDRLLSI